MSKLVDDDDARLAGKRCVQIEFFEYLAAIVHLHTRKDVQAVEKCRSLRPGMRLDKADHDLDTIGFQPARTRQHRVGLADTGRCAQKNSEFARRSFSARASNASGSGLFGPSRYM